MALLTATVDTIHDPNTVAVQHLGADEHRLRRTRFRKIDTNPSVKIDPCSNVVTILTTELAWLAVDEPKGAHPSAGATTTRRTPTYTSGRTPPFT